MFGQLRLIVALIGLAAFLGLGVVALKYRGDAMSASARAAAAESALATAAEVNRQNVAALKEMERRQAMADATTAALASKLAALREENQTAAEEIEELKRNDKTVDDFLRMPVPDALQRLLDK